MRSLSVSIAVVIVVISVASNVSHEAPDAHTLLTETARVSRSLYVTLGTAGWLARFARVRDDESRW